MKMNEDYRKNFEAVKSATKIEEVVQGYFPLKKSGANFTAKCPFHNDKTASFTVSPAKQIASCFGCGKTKMDVINFVSLYENIKPFEAMEKLAGMHNIPLQGCSHQSAEQNPLYETNAAAATTFSISLATMPRDLKKKHLLQRGINTPDMVRKWGIGWAEYASPLPARLAEHGQTLGLINDKGNCRFGGRITFQLLSITGKILGFAGKDAEGKSDAKYINSPESEIYKKGEFLYGLYYAARHIKSENFAVIVEGYYDCILMHEAAGASMTVATCGTALTEGQARALARHTDTAYLMFDDDVWESEKKLETLEAAMLRLWAAGIGVTFLRCPKGSDPADLALAHGSQALEACEQIRPATFYHDILKKDIAATADGLAKIKSILQLQDQLRDICLLYGVTIQFLHKLVHSKKNNS